jgi:hypothetical protein
MRCLDAYRENKNDILNGENDPPDPLHSTASSGALQLQFHVSVKIPSRCRPDSSSRGELKLAAAPVAAERVAEWSAGEHEGH